MARKTAHELLSCRDGPVAVIGVEGRPGWGTGELEAGSGTQMQELQSLTGQGRAEGINRR